MTLFDLILRGLRQRSLSSILTGLSVALGVMLVTAILLLQNEMERHFQEPGRGYGLVVGAPGSALQLVLNSIYHIDRSPGLMPMHVWYELEEHDSVAMAVPYAVGDTFQGYRVVATTDAIFEERFPHPAGTGEEKLAAGRPFRFDRDRLEEALTRIGARYSHEAVADGENDPPETSDDDEYAAQDEHDDEHAAHDEHDDEHAAHDDEHAAHDDEHDEHAAHDEHDDEHAAHDDEHAAHDEHDDEHAAHDDEHAAHDDHGHHHHGHGGVHEAVLGAEVARALRVAVGSQIEPTHGVEGGAAHEHEHLWDVVGILEPTGTPVDKVVFINLDSFYSIEEHAEGAMIPGSDDAALSSLLIFPRGGVHKVVLLSSLNRRPDIQIADVQEQVGNLFDIVGSVDILFLLVSLMVVVIGVLSILVAIYNTMNERRREMAILRAIGAGRRTVFAVIVGEAVALTGAGALCGVAMGHGLVVAVASRVESVAGFRPEGFVFLPVEWMVLGMVLVLGALAGLVPAWKAYRTDVAQNLRPLS